MIISPSLNTSFVNLTKTLVQTDGANQAPEQSIEPSTDTARPITDPEEPTSTQQQSLDQSPDKETDPNNGLEFDPEQLEIIRDLAQRDREVRAHEQAHAAVGGAFAGAPTYETTRGPDGRQYAVSGEVSIDVSAIPGNPEATLRKAEIVRRAALAPAEPSQQDRAVAAVASQLAQQARTEIAQQGSDGTQRVGGDEESNNTDSESQTNIKNDQNEQVINLPISRAAENAQQFDVAKSSLSAGLFVDQFA